MIIQTTVYTCNDCGKTVSNFEHVEAYSYPVIGLPDGWKLKYNPNRDNDRLRCDECNIQFPLSEGKVRKGGVNNISDTTKQKFTPKGTK